jgi:hypothetical protein
MNVPTLSVVIPTREGLDLAWLDHLLKVRGSVEFILVHPPGMTKLAASDPRLLQINSAFRGEIMQRLTGLMNASGTYVLSMNCDEYLFPEILALIDRYFAAYPDSWMLRLSTKIFNYGDPNLTQEPWAAPTTIDHFKILDLQTPFKVFASKEYLMETPIAPLDNPLDFKSLTVGRRDLHGRHPENFDKTVWRNDRVQATLQDLISTMQIGSTIKYVPFWCLDRLLGLMLQAKFFEVGKIIGHKMPLPEQLRTEENPPNYKRVNRYYILAELLLIKRFPRIPYFWNLAMTELRDTLRALLRENSLTAPLVESWKNSRKA